MVGATLSRAKSGPIAPLDHEIGTNSAVFAINDVLDITSGFLSVLGGTTDRPYGICKKTVTMSADNQTVAKVQVPFVPLDMDSEFEMELDAATAQANVGQFFNFNTGGTGAQTINFSSASDTVGQVLLVKLDPRDEGSTTRGRFKVALPELAFEPEA